MTRPVVLIICDGWGVGASDPAEIERQGNAVAMARTPVHDRMLAEHPASLLTTSGEAVGLPPGLMGNSEVGHLNLGAGRIVHQDLTRINNAIHDGSFFDLPELAELADTLERSGGKLHLLGLCSDAGVHSDIGHLKALLDWADRAGLPARIHAITDGRDASPTAGLAWIRWLEERTARSRDARIATVSGRYLAMDRDKRWERTGQAYRVMAEGAGPRVENASGHVARCYEEGTTDEFVPPVMVGSESAANPRGIDPNDGILFFNYRADRARQLTAALADEDFHHFDRPRGAFPTFVAMTRYQDDFPHPVLFPPRTLDRVLGQVLAEAGCTQLRMAETEKYGHVTYFFNGGIEEPFAGEERHLIQSLDVPTYDLRPEMSAPELTDALTKHIAEGRHDFILVNYANADMVGHTGSIPATVTAVETVDACLGRLLEAIGRAGGAALVTADHGNAERMLDDEGRPHTAHTTHPVRLILVRSGGGALRDGILADVAPTVLALMGIPQPPEMTGRSLLS
ncbi:MAG: 2,3-bisphosphoglycerate-independent phosphoglycerate mutase [Gemmatimonadetes bacterium]|nr:2,3-bisphosphoglycerate-independent phosphoglycerate mutase [Gemmatimonadota bacterium]